MKRLGLVTAVVRADRGGGGDLEPRGADGIGPAGGTAGRYGEPKLPALPAEVKQRKRWIIGVKCDAPPFGYIDVQGKNAGFDVEIARWFSRYAFGRDEPRHVRVRADGGPRAAR